MSSARSASVRGLNPLHPKSLATYRVSWVGSLRTFRLSSIWPASTSIGMTWLCQLLLWLAGEYWGRYVGFAALCVTIVAFSSRGLSFFSIPPVNTTYLDYPVSPSLANATQTPGKSGQLRFYLYIRCPFQDHRFIR